MRFWGILSLATLAVAAPAAQGTVKARDADVNSNYGRAAAIIEAFRHSWTGYKTYAWGYDELLPVSNKGGNSRNGWGASIADALSTAILMRQRDVVHDCLQHLSSVDFTKTSTEVSLFETTIRYLGGLISAYDLLTGPYADLASSRDKRLVKDLLQQAVVLADRLSFAFDTPTGIPYNNLNFASNSSGDTTNGVATIGTLVLEWTRLSDLTGDSKYARLAQKAEGYLLDPHPSLGEPFLGMLGTNVDIKTGQFRDSSGGWSGGTDSFYEYLLKMWIYDQSRYKNYLDRWVLAVESTMKYLLQTPEKGVTWVAEYSSADRIRKTEGHLTCFIGGNLMLGGTLIGRKDIKQAGMDLTDGCRHAYKSTPSGLAPERWSWELSGVPADQVLFFTENGFYATTNGYYLRPEVIESYYHGYALTGDPKYQQWAWDAFLAINRTARTPSGYSSINDVMQANGGGQDDFQESFWFAEVLKYLYMIFEGESAVGVRGGRNQWVFNTEAHPIRVKLV
ncbi:glycoside hydrolase [Pyronema omphalodes]|nr:glycoside hydrolase [Pyronema omphalodes]